MSSTKRVLIVSVKAGAGHLRAAQAVEGAFREAHREVDVRNVDALSYTNAAFRKGFVAGYEKLVTAAPSLWGMIYGDFERRPADYAAKRLAVLIDRMHTVKFMQMVQEFDPDHVVCTHYLPAEPLAVARRKGKLRGKLSVVLTDYDIHTLWIQLGVDEYFVATEEMACALMAKGVGAAQVTVTGIPVLPEFSRTYPDRATLRRKLGLREKPATILVMAGGFGLGKVDAAVALLADMIEEDVQLLAIAGRNEELHAALQAVAAKRPGKVTPFGFVTNMHELMAASDFAVTKPGGLTSSECLALALPMVIVNPIPGQEERNSDFLLESGVALRANSPAHMVYKVQRLIRTPRLLQRMRVATKQVARPRAAFDIAYAVMKQ